MQIKCFKIFQNDLNKTNNEIEIPKERYVYLEEGNQIINELRLV